MSGGSSGLGSLGSFKNALDPLNIFGGSSSSILGNIVDPGNIFGGNPQASTNRRLGAPDPTGGVPQTQSALGNIGPGSLQPHFYDPNSFAPRQMTGGSFNQMAQQMAGPQYMPQLMSSPQASIPSTPHDVMQQSMPDVMQQSMPHSGGLFGHPNLQLNPLNMNGEPNPQIGPGMMAALKARYGFGGNPAANSTRPMPPQMPANWYSSSIGGGIPGGI